MNREILFRGKSYTDDKWHYGLYSYQRGTPFAAERHEIFDGALGWNCPPETIGQYTGLTDKNSVKIFEGDIVHLSCKEGEWDAVVTFGNPNGFYSWGWQLRPIKDTHFNEDILLWVETEDANVSCEVISNVYYGAQEAAQAGEGGQDG